MIDYLYRFLIGGLVVSAFAVLADVIRPKGFAGLFAAAPSVALATLLLTVHTQGATYASLEARSMTAGATAFLLYALAVLFALAIRHWRVAWATFGLLPVWGAGAWVLGCLWLAGL